MHTRAGEYSTHGNLPVSYINMQLIAAPVMTVSLTAHLRTDVAACRQLLQHAAERLPALPFDACSAIGHFRPPVRCGLTALRILTCLLPLLLFKFGCSPRRSLLFGRLWEPLPGNDRS